jgi:tetratricopeptide (TPR) repeat protein
MRPADRVGRLALAARLNDRGLRHKACGRYDKASRCYERALEAIRQAPDPPPGALAAVYHNLGGLHYVVGAFPAAERAAREGIAARCRSAGDTAGLAADMIALAAIVDGQGRYDEGERLYLAGLAVLRLLPDAHPLEIAVALN